MSGPAAVSGRTATELAEVAGFFGIDLPLNKHIFRNAALVDGRAFEVVIRALAEAVRQDVRYGIGRRIRENIAQEKAKK